MSTILSDFVIADTHITRDLLANAIKPWAKSSGSQSLRIRCKTKPQFNEIREILKTYSSLDITPSFGTLAFVLSKKPQLDLPAEQVDPHITEFYACSPSEICTFFWRGNCSRGSTCLYKHVHAPIPGQSGACGVLCRAFLTGYCQNGNACSFAHVNPRLIREQAHNGIICIHSLLRRCTSATCAFAHPALSHPASVASAPAPAPVSAPSARAVVAVPAKQPAATAAAVPVFTIQPQTSPKPKSVRQHSAPAAASSVECATTTALASSGLPTTEGEWEQYLESRAPEHFLCPINQCIMRDPVMAADGITYERTAIEDWFAKKGCADSPLKIEMNGDATLTPNEVLHREITAWAWKQRLGDEKICELRKSALASAKACEDFLGTVLSGGSVALLLQRSVPPFAEKQLPYIASLRALPVYSNSHQKKVLKAWDAFHQAAAAFKKTNFKAGPAAEALLGASTDFLDTVHGLVREFDTMIT